MKTFLSLSLLSILLAACSTSTETVYEEPEELEEEEVAVEETGGSELLVLDSSASECTDAAVTSTNDMGGSYTSYPVAAEYNITVDDFHNLAGLFTAAACGDARVQDLFGSETFEDVKVFVQNPSEDLINYLKQNAFACSDEGVSDEDCGRWYNESSVELDVMTGLREWADQIYGSDCQNCG